MSRDSTNGYDQTIEVRRPSGTLSPDGPAIHLVQGSTPALSSETNDLLRRRLRSASLVLFAGFAAFLVRGLFYLDRIDTTLEMAIFANHVLVTVVTGLVGLRLCRNCVFVLEHLRVFELLVFIDSALFFLLMNYWLLTDTAPKGYLIPITPYWIVLLFVYALFIPNTLRRAIAVIGALAATPILMCVVLYWTSADYARVIQNNPDFGDFILQTTMLMVLVAVAAVWGAHTMGSLRVEAFEARQLGHYKLKQQLGAGGMGDVYLAEHTLLKRPCAIKLIKPERAGDPQALARFEREVRATAKLSHWNTIEVYDYGRAEDGTFYYVMEYLPGMNLQQLVEAHGPLPAARVIHLISQACEALNEAHRRGLIHRDIKPANIFAARRGDIYDVTKLLDFGLVKPLAGFSEASVTSEGTITGSPLCMSPEMVLGSSEPDARSDVYSLGVVAYFLITGVYPFESERPIEVMMAHARDVPSPLSAHHSEVPIDLERIIQRCLEKDPDHRFQSASDLQLALQECSDAGTWTRDLATCWWESNGCPKKKALDKKVLDEVSSH